LEGYLKETRYVDDAATIYKNYQKLNFVIYFCFYKNNFIRTRGSFFAQNLWTIKNNPSLSRRTKSQIL